MTRESIQFIINIWDPKYIIYYDEEGDQGTCNYDEYDAEVDVICKCLALSGGTCSTERLEEILRVVFAEYFGKENFLWDEKPREDAKTFAQVAEEILHDTITVGTNIFDVEPKTYAIEVDKRIIAKLFNEEVHAELVRHIEGRKAALARLKILQETYREEDFDTNLPLTFQSLVENFFGHKEVAEKILAAYKTPEEMLQAGFERVSNLVKSYRNIRPVAKIFFAMLELSLAHCGGELPETFAALFEVPNLGKGTIARIRHKLIRNSDVDYKQHVQRVMNRTKIAEDDTSWEDEHKLFWHGQKVCADEPKCSICPLLSCPSRC